MSATSIVTPSPIQSNQLYILVTILLSSFIWVIFKLLYPYPFITIDSYYYIAAAYQNANAGSWPIGYSKFLQLIGLLSHSHLLLVTIQYIILQSSFLLFFITIRKLLQFQNWASLILYIFLFLNPLFIYGSNHLMSDIIFMGLTILWISNLIWILLRPQPYMIISQALLLVIIFSIRYTALFFPIFTLLVFILSPQVKWQKIAGIGLTFLLLAVFIQFTRVKMEEIGGVRQFSSAGGWKQASNALYMYEHIANKDSTKVPEKFQLLHKLAKAYFRGPHEHVDLYHIDQEFTTGSYYVAAHESPLMQYLRIKKGENADIFDFKNIAPFGPLYNSYGNYLILHRPIKYLQYVVLPNFIAYLYPFPEIYGAPEDLYFLWPNYMGDIAKSWFNLKTISIPVERIQFRSLILSPYASIFFIIHLLFITCLTISLYFRLQSKVNKSTLNILIVIAGICIGNFVFISLSATSVLRFQFPFIALELAFIVFIASYIFKS